MLLYKTKDTDRVSIIRNIYVSTKHRDVEKYPSPSKFTLDLPIIINKVHGVLIENYKYTAEPLINNNNREFTFTANSGTVSGTIRLDKGDYNQSIIDLLAEINTELNPYDVHFTLNTTTKLVEFTFSGAFITNYFAIPSCKLLKLLGYENGICLYRTGSAPGTLPANTTGYDTIAAATNSYRIVNDTDMIIKIKDIEAILSTDIICNRASSILLSSRSPYKVVEKCPPICYPLLQVQHRIQQLRVEILNSEGDPYDLQDEDASFIIQFHCYQEYES